MRVLVTGGAGLIGSHAAEYYAKRGEQVIALDNLTRSQIFAVDKKTVEHNWDYLGRYQNIDRVNGDIRNIEDVQKVIRGAGLVIHAAAQPGVPTAINRPIQDLEINTLGTLNVLESLRQYSPQAKFIYCSTNKVYGLNVEKFAQEELATRYAYKDINGIDENLTTDFTQRSPYGVSKYAAELYVQEYARLYRIRTAIFRMSCIYGERQFGCPDQGWVAWFVIASILNQSVTIYGNGKQVRDLLYVQDLIAAFAAFADSDIEYEVFNIGGGAANTVSLIELLRLLQQETSVSLRVSFAKSRFADQRVYVSNIEKVREKLNWQPQVGVLEGIRSLIKWAQQHKSLF